MKVIRLFNNQNSWIKRAAENDKAAQRHLFDRYAPKMLGVCRQYTKNLEDAEEVLLNGFLKVFKHLGSFRSEGSFEGWIRRIMVREAISFLRTRNSIEEEEIRPDHHFSDPLNAEVECQEIQSLIDSLPQGYQLVFVLHAIEGYRHCEIAEMLSISEGTSKSQLYKAKKLLQEKIKEQNTTYYVTK